MESRYSVRFGFGLSWLLVACVSAQATFVLANDSASDPGSVLPVSLQVACVSYRPVIDWTDAGSGVWVPVYGDPITGAEAASMFPIWVGRYTGGEQHQTITLSKLGDFDDVSSMGTRLVVSRVSDGMGGFYNHVTYPDDALISSFDRKSLGVLPPESFHVTAASSHNQLTMGAQKRLFESGGEFTAISGGSTINDWAVFQLMEGPEGEGGGGLDCCADIMQIRSRLDVWLGDGEGGSSVLQDNFDLILSVLDQIADPDEPDPISSSHPAVQPFPTYDGDADAVIGGASLFTETGIEGPPTVPSPPSSAPVWVWQAPELSFAPYASSWSVQVDWTQYEQFRPVIHTMLIASALLWAGTYIWGELKRQ